MNRSSARVSRMAATGGSRAVLTIARGAVHALLPSLLLACSPGVGGSDSYVEHPIAEATDLQDSFTGVVTRISDGDTLRVDIQDSGSTGLDPGENLRIRLLRIDTPELSHDRRPAECLAEEAAAHLEALAPPGTVLTLAHDLEKRDRFGRELAHAWLPDGTWLNGRMLEDGYAMMMTLPPNVAFTRQVQLAQQMARTASRGLWDRQRCP